MRTMLVLALLASTLVPAAAAQPSPPRDETPERFVRRVYSNYRHNGPGVSTLRPAGTPYYSAALLDAFAKDSDAAHGEVGAIDGDPICNCQDFDALRVTRISVSALQGDMVKAEVGFDVTKEHEAVTLTLTRTQQGWRIADIADKTMKSLMALLQESLAHPAQEPPTGTETPAAQKP